MSILYIKTPNNIEEEINIAKLSTIDSVTTFQKFICIPSPIEFKCKYNDDDDDTKSVIFLKLERNEDHEITGHELCLATTNMSSITEEGDYTVSWNGIEDWEGQRIGQKGSRICLRAYDSSKSFCNGQFSFISTNGVNKALSITGESNGKLTEARLIKINDEIKTYYRRLDGHRGSGYITYGSGFTIQFGTISLATENPYNLSFPISFSKTPVVQATIRSSSTSAMFIVKSDAVTTTGCKLVGVKHNNAYQTSGIVNWMAIGW